MKSTKLALTQIIYQKKRRKKKHAHANIKHNILKELAPSVLPQLKKNNNKMHMELGHASIVDPYVDLLIADKKNESMKKKWTKAINFFNIV